jgi:TusA-related sulfurtransferase
VDPESTTVESYVLISRPNKCLRPGAYGDSTVVVAASPLAGQVQRAGPSFDALSADATSMISEIVGVSASASVQQKRLEDIIGRGCPQLAMSEALLMRRMNPNEALHLFLDAGGAIENIEAIDVLERKHDPDRLSTLNHVNILVEILTYVTQRLKRLRGFCLMCGQRIVLDLPTGAVSVGTSYITSGKKMLCCTKATCQFQHVEMKHMLGVPIEIVPASISGDIINNEDLVDLFICLAYSATGSQVSNREKIFDPAPPFIVGTSRFDKIHSLVNSIPKVSSMRQHAEDGESQLRRFLNGINDGLYPFLHWLLHVKRGVMVKIPPKRRIPEFKTEHQFVMLAGTDPERRVQFNEWRAQYSSYFAFHGSAAENWHSILRNGLRNLSGTDLQRNGAAYGSGVYMAKDAATSFSYSRVGSNWGHSKFGSSSLLCLAIAEVCKGPGVPLVPNPYYVVREDKFIMTRFFLFYPGNSSENVLADQLGLARYFDDDPKATKEKLPAHLYNKDPM